MKHFCFIVNNSTIYKENSGHHHDVRCPNTKTTIYEKRTALHASRFLN